jgi:hypothetical protein
MKIESASVDVLVKERDEYISKVKALNDAIAILGGVATKGRRGRKGKPMSEATKKKLSEAATKRWAAKKKAAK